MINHIARVSIVAMCVPVAALVVLMSVFNGLEGMVTSLYRAIDPDITITPASGSTIPTEELDIEALRKVEGVESLTLTLEQGAMVEHNGRRAMVNLKGVDENYTEVLPIAERVVAGNFSVEGQAMVMASGVMNDLGLNSNSIREQIRLYAIDRTRFSTLLPTSGFSMQEMMLAAAYSIDEDNSHVVITSLGNAQQLLRYGNRISKVELRISPEASDRRVAELLQAEVGNKARVLTRHQSNSLYRLMALEKWGVFGIAALVVLIASLSIVGTIVMVMIEKRDDIATLRTMGATERLIGRIFTCEGLLMATLSGMAGIAIGVALTLLQQHAGVIRLDAASLSIDAYPVELRWGDVGAIAVVYALIAFGVIRLTVKAMMSKRA